MPEGLRLVHLPFCSPELQSAERFWPLVDEPVANKHFETLADLEAGAGKRCQRLYAATEAIKTQTGFRCWPKPCHPN